MVFSHIMKNENEEEIIYVHFESPTDYGFDSVRFELPSCKILYKEGNYTDEEIELFHTVVGGSSTKIWLTKSGGCIVANNNSKIPNRDLSELLQTIIGYSNAESFRMIVY